MLTLYCLVSRFLHDRKGVTAIEYVVIAGVIVGIIGTAFSTSIGPALTTKLGTITTALGG